MALDPLSLSQDLIRCASVTPLDEGALGVLETALSSLGFACQRLRFEAPETAPIDNLYARIGRQAPHLCFAGHTDVVPLGDAAQWTRAPFGAEIVDDVLYGRGAADMKTAIAAFACAAERHLTKRPLKGSISFLITGDEEGIAINGTRKMLDWLSKNGQVLDHCIVGEPTSAATSGDTLKIGRRGSINFRAVVRGIQGHVGYPQRALNPIPILAALVSRLASEPLDSGTPHFEPSTLAFTSVDVGNDATNVIPAEAAARFNIRFNDLHTPDTLKLRIETTAMDVARQMGGDISVTAQVSGVAFLTAPGPFTALLSEAVEKVTGRKPDYSTSGGTSDARFIKDFCPVAELGLPGTTMHKVDECMPVAEIHRLTDIYESVLDHYFANPPR
ncbi:MAG TPA: succinyl-diaminopimelate desuccinylase [Rhizomicrobium sp.]|nr:succinyl-diaminopimelate desuccinylase [Rhizomicrobium sp.]